MENTQYLCLLAIATNRFDWNWTVYLCWDLMIHHNTEAIFHITYNTYTSIQIQARIIFLKLISYEQNIHPT